MKKTEIEPVKFTNGQYQKANLNLHRNTYSLLTQDIQVKRQSTSDYQLREPSEPNWRSKHTPNL
jgi:hypothetical protein